MPMAALPALSAAPAHHAAANGDWTDGVFYPSSDGLPMADNQAQSEEMTDCLTVLRDRHRDAFVAINLLLYFRKGDPGVRLAPDVIVAFGVPEPKRWRCSYRIWDEGKPPDWVLEIVSGGTVGRDKGVKKDEYAKMGVREYWLFDPKGTVFDAGEPRLQGYALAGDQYQPLCIRQEQGVDVITSCVLGLDLLVEDNLIRFRDPVTGERLRRHEEVESARREEAAGRRKEAAARRAAEARTREEAAARQAAEALTREEAAVRQAAEARVAELEALLRGRQGESG